MMVDAIRARLSLSAITKSFGLKRSSDETPKATQAEMNSSRLCRQISSARSREKSGLTGFVTRFDCR